MKKSRKNTLCRLFFEMCSVTQFSKIPIFRWHSLRSAPWIRALIEMLNFDFLKWSKIQHLLLDIVIAAWIGAAADLGRFIEGPDFFQVWGKINFRNRIRIIKKVLPNENIDFQIWIIFIAKISGHLNFLMWQA